MNTQLNLRTWVDLARRAQGFIAPELKAQTSIYPKFDENFRFLDNQNEFKNFASRGFQIKTLSNPQTKNWPYSKSH